MCRHFLFAATILSLAFAVAASAVAQEDIRELKLRDWHPRSMLVTKVTKVDKPMFPVIDQHNHLGTGKAFLTPERVNHYLQEMDAAGVRTVVDLDGMWGNRLKETLDALDNAHPGRFLTYVQIDFDGLDDADWSQREANRLEESFKMGAKGLKFHKTLGLEVKFKNGKYLMPGDAKMDPIYEMCAKYHRPIMIHTSDPAAFFTPLDQYNERWHELNAHPDWLFYGKDFPSRKELLDSRMRAVAKNPHTIFIGAHCGNDPEDLCKWASGLTNIRISTSTSTRGFRNSAGSPTRWKFLIKYQDRVLFGTDTPPNDREAYRIYYRFMETDDEYFDCAKSHHLQGFWMIYGVYLPKEVLAKIYYQNAERILYFGDNAAKESSATNPGTIKVRTIRRNRGHI